MGREWTNVKFVFEERSGPTVEASANPKTQEEVLFEFVRNKWRSENLPAHSGVDVMWGGPSKAKIKEWMTEMFDACEYVEQAAVVSVSDSTHAGNGWIFEQADDGSVNIIDEISGYEGADGHDVAGMINDEYDIGISAEWLWD